MIEVDKHDLNSALHSPRLDELKEDAVMRAIDTAVKRCYTLAGRKWSDEMMCNSKLELKNYLSRYPDMTTGEVALALAMGVRGELEKDTYLNIANMQMWLKTYHDSTSRNSIRNEILSPSKALPQPDEEARNREFFRTKPHEMMEALRNGDLTMEVNLCEALYATVYDYLAAQGLMDRIPQSVTDDAERKAQGVTGYAEVIVGGRRLKHRVETLRIKSDDRCKRYILTYYFQTLIDNNEKLIYEIL